MAKLVEDRPYPKIEKRIDRHGQTVIYYYVRKRGVRTRIKGTPGSPEFEEAYRSAAYGDGGPRVRPRSWDHLITRYIKSSEFSQRSDSTKRAYLTYIAILRGEKPGLKQGIGDTLVADFRRYHAKAIRDKFASRPRKANYVLQVITLLQSFAVDLEWIAHNPALGIKKLQSGPGYRPWSDLEIARFQTAWSRGTWERTAFELLLGTAQRGQDVRIMALSHVDITKGTVRVRQQKTGERLIIPIIDDLREALEVWMPHRPTRTDILLPAPRTGSAYGDHAFRHRMRDAIKAADLPADCHTHGLRHTATTILVEARVDPQIIRRITGHKTLDMVLHYSRQLRGAEQATASLQEHRRRIQENKNES